MSHDIWNAWMVQCTMTEENDRGTEKWWRERVAECILH